MTIALWRHWKRRAALAAALVLGFGFSLGSGSAVWTAHAQTEPAPPARTCGEITVAQFEWRAAELAAVLAQRVLEDAFGCDALLTPASPDRTLAAIAGGAELIVAPGVSAEAVADRPEIAGAPLFGAASEGWFAPAWMFERDRNFGTVLDVAADPSKFQAEGADRPKLHICPERWDCHAENLALIDRLDLGDRFEIVTPGSGAELAASVAAAYAAQEPWLGYAWRPSELPALFPLRRLSTAGVEICAEDGACRTPFESFQPQTAYSPAIADAAPEVAAFLERFLIPSDWVIETLAWRDDQDAEMTAAAARLLESRPELWRGWLSPRARAAFEASLPPASAEN